jgi:predicted permease
MTGLFSSIRYALRAFRRNPLFTAVAVLSLALGIGANTAVFTLLDQLVLRLLPVSEPERLVMIWPTEPHMGSNSGVRATSYPMYQDFQRQATAFESVFCEFDTSVTIGFESGTERANVQMVSGNYFQALRVSPAVGRVFSPESDDRNYKGHPSIVLSYRYWISRFAGDPKVVGRTILVNHYPMEIVGVSAPGFTGLDPSYSPDIRVPVQMKPVITPGWDDMGERRSQWIHVFARLKPGYTVESASASLQPLFHQILQQEAADARLNRMPAYWHNLFFKRTVRVETAATGYSNLRERYANALVVLMCMAGLILLVSCSNVASLLIARAVARQKEIAVRLAIGASRRTLMAHLLVESVLLSLAGAGLGLLLAESATRGLLSMLPEGGTKVLLRAEPDLRVLLFSIAVALVTGLLFGLAPALQSTKLDLFAALKEAAGAVAGSGGSARLRKALVTAQVALSFLLLAGAGLFARTLFQLKNTATGFENAGKLVTFQVDASANGYSLARIRSFYRDALREIRATPGVSSAAFARLPLLQGWGWDSRMRVEGHQSREDEDMQAFMNFVSPGYWQAMGIPLIAGRDFDARDHADTEEEAMRSAVAIVNRKFAEHFFGNQNPIGRHLGWGGEPGTLYIRIVGVVENSLYEGPRSGVRRQVFLPYEQIGDPTSVSFYVRTAGDPAALFGTLRRVVTKVDGAVPIYGMKTLDAQLDDTLSTERLIASLSVVFGALATVLAALGLYGVMAFVVARRTKEIGLRMALGAPRSQVLWLVLREALILLGAGLLAGVPCAYLLSRFVSAQLFGVTPTDLWTCVTAIAILGLVAAASAFVPARRASAIDPITALRYE